MVLSPTEMQHVACFCIKKLNPVSKENVFPTLVIDFDFVCFFCYVDFLQSKVLDKKLCPSNEIWC